MRNQSLREPVQPRVKLELVRTPSPMALRILPHDWEVEEEKARRMRFVKDVVVVCAWGAITLLTVSAVIQAWEVFCGR